MFTKSISLSRLFAALLFCLITGAVLRAQQSDNPAYYPLTVQCSVLVPSTTQGGGGGGIVMWDEAQRTTVSSGIGGPVVPGQDTTYKANGNLTVKIYPNKDYICTATAYNNCTTKLSFVMPSTLGFVMYINGVPATTYSYANATNGNGTSTPFTLRIGLPTNYSLDPAPAYLPAGTANSMVADKPILFFGLGRMRNGESAGVVGFRSQDCSSTGFFTPAALYFSNADTAPVSEVDPIYVSGSNPKVIQQILSPEVLVNVTTLSGTSYKLDYYSRSDPAVTVTQSGGQGTVCSYTGSPFVTYTVSQNTTTGVTVSRVEDSVTWKTDLVLTGTTWKFNNWYKQGTSFDSNLTTVFNTSTAATVTANGPASGLAGYTDAALSWSKAYTNYSWGRELTNTTFGASTSLPLASNSAYYTTTGTVGTPGAFQGQLQWSTNPNGTWSSYVYYVGDASTATTIPSGYVQRIYHPWLDSTGADTSGTTAAAATTSNSAYDDYTYAYVNKGESGGSGGTAKLFMRSGVSSYAPGGTLLSKSTWDYVNRATTLNSRFVWSSTQKDYSDGSNFLTTTSLYYAPLASPDLLDDQPVSVTYPTGRKDSYAYFNGTWNPATNSFSGSASGNDRLVLCFHGQTSGGTAVTSWTNGSVTWSMDSVSMVGGYSTVSETVTDKTGRVVFSGNNVYTTSGALGRIVGTALTYDSHGRLTDSVDIIRSVGATQYKSHQNYTSRLLDSATAPDGVVTGYVYDDLLRLTQTTSGVGAPSIYPAKVLATTYDGVNRPVATYTCSCGTAPTIFWYDAAGRVLQKSDPSPNSGTPYITTYSYSSLTSSTILLPTGATTTNTSYADGRPKSVTGTAQPPACFTYAANGTGLLTSRISSASATDLSQGWSTTQSDLLGRTLTASSPTYGWTPAANTNNIIDAASTYSPTTGLLTKRTTTYRATASALAPDHLYSYDGSGRLTMDGMDINNDGALTAAGNDRIAAYGFSYSQDGWGWIATATTSSYPTSTALQVSKTVSRLTGFNNGGIGTYGLVIADTAVTDVNNQTGTQVESVNLALFRHHVDLTVPGVTQTGWTETINGYASEAQTISGARSKNEYDSRGRLVTVRSRWNGSTYAAADTITFNATNYSKQPDSQTIDGVTTSVAYAWGSGTSTVTTTDAANNSSYTLYNAMGRPWHTGGTAAAPVQNNYDALGRLTSMTTWRSGSYTEANWPSSGGDTTVWAIENATGLGTKKTFADGNHVDYTFTPLGQPLVRSWARGTTTTYAYYDGSTTTTSDVSHRTQELRSVTYSDGTPSVSYTYQRSGLPATVTDAATGAHTFGYNGSQPLRVASESFDSTFYGSRVMTQQYDAAFRATGFLLGAAVDSSSDLSQVTTYASATGLPSSLATAYASGTNPHTFTYNFNANSGLYTGYSIGTSPNNFALSYGYEATTNRRNQVSTTMNGLTLVQFAPSYDNRGQVKTMTQSGDAFANYYVSGGYNSVLNSYSYDAKGQLQSAALYRGTANAGNPAPADELPGRRFEFRYDSMGNRTSAGESGTPVSSGGIDDSYVANNLNQYDSRTNYTVRVLGTTASAPSGKSISTQVAGAPSTNQVDRAWAADIVPGQGDSVASAGVTVYSVIPDGSAGPKDLLKKDTTKSYTIPPAQQVFTHDADGNLTADGVWTYTYDAENRLVSMENPSSAIGTGKILAANARKLVFVYDYIGRRVRKQVYAGWNGSTYPTLQTDRKFIYNGWNLVAEYDALSTLTLKRSYTWGLDLTGSFNATGGVGALLQITDHGSSVQCYYAAYDHNGNVSALVRDNGSGAIAMGYEYSPFGELLRAETLEANCPVADNPFRFSTKYTDLETGLLYYGYRYYTPKEGRFINRDPIEETGGINLYAMNNNRAISGWDVLGLDASDELPTMYVMSNGCSMICQPNGGACEIRCPRGDPGNNSGPGYTPPISNSGNNNNNGTPNNPPPAGGNSGPGGNTTGPSKPPADPFKICEEMAKEAALRLKLAGADLKILDSHLTDLRSSMAEADKPGSTLMEKFEKVETGSQVADLLSVFKRVENFMESKPVSATTNVITGLGVAKDVHKAFHGDKRDVQSSIASIGLTFIAQYVPWTKPIIAGGLLGIGAFDNLHERSAQIDNWHESIDVAGALQRRIDQNLALHDIWAKGVDECLAKLKSN